jgi:hypothetical protein
MPGEEFAGPGRRREIHFMSSAISGGSPGIHFTPSAGSGEIRKVRGEL